MIHAFRQRRRHCSHSGTAHKERWPRHRNWASDILTQNHVPASCLYLTNTTRRIKGCNMVKITLKTLSQGTFTQESESPLTSHTPNTTLSVFALVQDDETVGQLKSKILEAKSFPVENQKLIYSGEPERRCMHALRRADTGVKAKCWKIRAR